MIEKLLFLDTNIFLHYRSFDQIDWPKVVDATAVTIVIPPVTFRELNKHKDSHSAAHIRKRAGDILKKLNRIFSDQAEAVIKPNVRIRIDPVDPVVREFDVYLQPEIQDDQLVASILLARQKYPTIDIVLIAADEGLLLRFKASEYEISCVKPDDAYRLPEQRDPNELRVRELQRENAELRRRIPDIKLTFKAGKRHKEFLLDLSTQPTAEEFSQKLDRLKKNLPLMPSRAIASPKPDDGTADDPQHQLARTFAQIAAATSFDTIRQEDIEEYNREIHKFYERYADFLTAEVAFANLQRRTLRLNIYLTNEGTVPAEDIDVVLHFPDGFELFDEDDLPVPPNKPLPPQKPRTSMQKVYDQVNSVISSDIVIPSIYGSHLPASARNVSAPYIQKTNSYVVDIHVDRAKHHMPEPFDTLFVVFASHEEAKSFEIKYSLHAANVPVPVEGKLHIVVKK